MKNQTANVILNVVIKRLSALRAQISDNKLYVYFSKEPCMISEGGVRCAGQELVRRLVFFVIALFVLVGSTNAQGQNVPILGYSTNSVGQVQLEIDAEADKYYTLLADHPNSNFESITSITIGTDGRMQISESLAAYPPGSYSITSYDIANPHDTDGDGTNDLAELANMPTDAPLNFASPIDFTDGTTSIPDAATFASMAVVADVPWAPFLDGQQFVKFGILDRDTDQPQIYFINSNTHFIHANFFDAIGANVNGDDGSGEIVFNPNEITPEGVIGTYAFNFSFGDALDFEASQRTFELLVANMPFIRNNMKHFIGTSGENTYESQYKDDFVGSRIEVILESEVFGDVDYLPFNKAEGFGFFRQMSLDDNPGSRDIVLYDALPNSLPRVGGIITSVIQTPLSHVNLRAIQDNVPNAYIKDPLQIDTIADLLGNYIYYKVEDERYYIREATLEEVNDWYENLRPTEAQIPQRDLSITRIMPLDSIEFEMSTAFGAKCSNVATMRKFGFPSGTIPDGFGVPFYYYDEFMKFNNFYQDVEAMINDPGFISDLETRIDMLKDFRKEIKDAPMPQWMLDNLQAMHDAFPVGTNVRVRSSTNNEDLPGFSGAGLYTSKTQRLDEGHISKSVKQVYASMWNFRAFDERDFYRVDHSVAAMGLLCHTNFDDEKSNGVGVSIDPIYQTENTFYLNTQVGEFLITNPDATSVPEEILLNEDPTIGYSILRASNLVNHGELVMEERYLDSMRNYLKVIHDEFAILYDVVGAEGFGMDIEYKVTAEDKMIIKQARPWVSFWAEIKAEKDLGIEQITEPRTSASLSTSELVSARVANTGLEDMSDFDLSLFVDGQFVETITIPDTIKPFTNAEFQFSVPQDFSMVGEYDIMATVNKSSDGYARNDTLNEVVSKLHVLEGGIEIGDVVAKCAEELSIQAIVSNYGEDRFTSTEIEVVVNGVVVSTEIYNNSILSLSQAEIEIVVTGNLLQNDNEIILNLLQVNAQQDAVSGNNSASSITDLTSSYDYVTLIINADDYPEETSWQVYDELANEAVAFGELSAGTQVYSEDICLDYASCFSLNFYDSANDGICCGYGQGNFFLLNRLGDTIFTNNGEFESETTEFFCPDGQGCMFNADVNVTNASTETSLDGLISINTTGGFGPFKFSIDQGQNFYATNTFSSLDTGLYTIIVLDTAMTCSYEETVEVGYGVTSSSTNAKARDIKVFPNPADEDVIVEVSGVLNFGGVNIELYNTLGSVIATSKILSNSGKKRAVLSLLDYPAGTYFVKCYNENFEDHTIIVKQ